MSVSCTEHWTWSVRVLITLHASLLGLHLRCLCSQSKTKPIREQREQKTIEQQVKLLLIKSMSNQRRTY